ncbi:MAG: type II toxin-antitoxin system RelE/ParE family toxin [Planctomycetota bacterium]
MANYEVVIKPSAVKELESVRLNDRRRIAIKIMALANNPRPPGCEKLSGLERYRFRQGNDRVIYEIEDARLIVVAVKVGHRRDVYR